MDQYKHRNILLLHCDITALLFDSSNNKRVLFCGFKTKETRLKNFFYNKFTSLSQ